VVMLGHRHEPRFADADPWQTMTTRHTPSLPEIRHTEHYTHEQPDQEQTAPPSGPCPWHYAAGPRSGA
jgi:hypothetical protein